MLGEVYILSPTAGNVFYAVVAPWAEMGWVSGTFVYSLVYSVGLPLWSVGCAVAGKCIRPLAWPVFTLYGRLDTVLFHLEHYVWDSYRE